MIELGLRNVNCTVDYFDSFSRRNRYDEPAHIISLRKDDTVYVEVNYPIRKRIIVPFNCVKFQCIA